MAQFVLTITSDSAEEIASFLSPGHATQARPNEPLRQEAQEQPVNTLQQPSSEEPKRKGRPPKNVSPASAEEESSTSVEPETTASPSVASAPEPASTDGPEAVTLADVKALINQAIKVKPAKAVVDALTVACGTAAPGAMDDGQLAKAKVTLEGLLNG